MKIYCGKYDREVTLDDFVGKDLWVRVRILYPDLTLYVRVKKIAYSYRWIYYNSINCSLIDNWAKSPTMPKFNKQLVLTKENYTELDNIILVKPLDVLTTQEIETYIDLYNEWHGGLEQ